MCKHVAMDTSKGAKSRFQPSSQVSTLRPPLSAELSTANDARHSPLSSLLLALLLFPAFHTQPYSSHCRANAGDDNIADNTAHDTARNIADNTATVACDLLASAGCQLSPLGDTMPDVTTSLTVIRVAACRV